MLNGGHPDYVYTPSVVDFTTIVSFPDPEWEYVCTCVLYWESRNETRLPHGMVTTMIYWEYIHHRQSKTIEIGEDMTTGTEQLGGSEGMLSQNNEMLWDRCCGHFWTKTCYYSDENLVENILPALIHTVLDSYWELIWYSYQRCSQGSCFFYAC